MDIKDAMKLQHGRWLMANCGKMENPANCKLVMMAPESQREDLLAALTAHAVNKHGSQNNPELRQQLSKAVEAVEA